MSNQENCTKCCPYFAFDRQECLMTTGGLYIPMIQHVNILCTTQDFIRCHHYLQGWTVTQDVVEKLGMTQEPSRRRYRRVNAQIPLRIIDCEQHGPGADALGNEAVAMDLSWGGIRLSTNVALPVRKTVAFQFVHDGALPPVSGCQGEVRWSRQVGSGDFQAGLLVTDKKTFDAFRHHMVASDLLLL